VNVEDKQPDVKEKMQRRRRHLKMEEEGIEMQKQEKYHITNWKKGSEKFISLFENEVHPLCM
jgi:hypothetical protein